jgi:hypothetical protein
VQKATELAETEDFQSLARALRRAQGFALYFAICNVSTHRRELASRLKAMLTRPVIEVELSSQDDPYKAIEEAVRAAPQYVVRLLREHAPDFFDWNSGLYASIDRHQGDYEGAQQKLYGIV